MIKKMLGSLIDRHKLESCYSRAAQNAADIQYLAMMSDVELDSDSDVQEVESNVEEV